MTLSLQDIERLLKESSDGQWCVGAPPNKVILCNENGSVKTTSNGFGKVVAVANDAAWTDGAEFYNAELIAVAPTLARQLIEVMKERDALLKIVEGCQLRKYCNHVPKEQLALLPKETP